MTITCDVSTFHTHRLHFGLVSVCHGGHGGPCISSDSLHHLVTEMHNGSALQQVLGGSDVRNTNPTTTDSKPLHETEIAG